MVGLVGVMRLSVGEKARRIATDPDRYHLRAHAEKHALIHQGISFAFPYPVTSLRYSYAHQIAEAKGNTVLWLPWQTDIQGGPVSTRNRSFQTKAYPPYGAV